VRASVANRAPTHPADVSDAARALNAALCRNRVTVRTRDAVEERGADPRELSRESEEGAHDSPHAVEDEDRRQQNPIGEASMFRHRAHVDWWPLSTDALHARRRSMPAATNARVDATFRLSAR
jgi:hypothetical protein